MFKNRKTRYIPSMGLSFNEDNEINRLSKMAKEGWIFKSFSMLGYIFEKGQPKDQIYSLDMYELKREEKEEYIKMFEDAGWCYVCSCSDFYHFFSAAPGTQPIYSDNVSLLDKYLRVKKLINKAVIILGIIGSVALGLNISFNAAGVDGAVSFITGLVSAFGFSSMFMMIVTSISTGLRIKRIKACKKLI